MVRNMKGGRKSKGMGRKHVTSGTQQKTLRLPQEEGELYAGVTKILGNAMVEVLCLDGKKRICMIRQKFRGRSKRDHTISVASWVLIGLRDWETTKDGKLDKCDLLDVYSSSDIEKLKKTDIDWTPLTSIEDKNGQKMIEDNQDILFEEESEPQENTIATETPIVFTEDNAITGEDEIDIDDI